MTSRITGTAADLLRLPLDKPVGGSGVAQIDVIAVDLTDSDGATGTGFSYCLGGGSNVVLAAAHDLLQNFVGDQPANSPERLWRRMDQSLNRVGRGAHYLAMAAIDVAAWDLHAKRRGEPLGVTMGGSPRTVPVYGSGGYRPNFSPEQARDQALVHVEQGFPAIKPRLAGNASDAARLAAVRDAVPDEGFDRPRGCEATPGTHDASAGFRCPDDDRQSADVSPRKRRQRYGARRRPGSPI